MINQLITSNNHVELLTDNDGNDHYYNQIKTLNNNDDSMDINFYLTTNAADGQSQHLLMEENEEKQLNINLALNELNGKQMDGNELNDGTVCLELYDNEQEPSISRLIAAVQSEQSSNLNHPHSHHHHSEISLSFKPDSLAQHESTLLVYVPEHLEFIEEKQEEDHEK